MNSPAAKATQIAIDLCGRPERCTGWKAKIFNGAFEGAIRGIEAAAELRIEEIGEDPDHLTIARRCATDVLMARLTRADLGRRDKLRSRIALIRSGHGDTVPEVQAAMLALKEAGPWIKSGASDGSETARGASAPQGRTAARSGAGAERRPSSEDKGADAPAPEQTNP